jgi:hypothetical protein
VSSYEAFVRGCGVALAIAGLLMIVVNVIVTPLLPSGESFAATAASTAFLWRQSLAAVAAVMLMFGAIGLYLRQINRWGAFGALTFAVALIGSALLLATEWIQIFETRDLARRAPETLNSLDAAGVGLDDIGAMAAMATLVVGWIGLALLTLRSGIFSRQTPKVIIAGFFATPFLSAVLPPVVAGAIGNTILGGGLAALGWELSRRTDSSQ